VHDCNYVSLKYILMLCRIL